MLPIVPITTTSLLQNQTTILELQRASTAFGPNLAMTMTQEDQKALYKWMQETYIWPRLIERRPFEELWDKLYRMSKAVIRKDELTHDRGGRNDVVSKSRRRKKDKMEVADTMIFDAIDRLTNINHFVSFKERLPVRYQKPEWYVAHEEQPGYSPVDDIYRAGNCLLDWNSANQSVFVKHSAAARQHYTYGTCILHSDYIFRVKPTQRRDTERGGFKEQPEISEIGVTFDPISLRKVWFDYRLPIWELNKQACVFLYDFCHPFHLYDNQYDPVLNPMGYAPDQIAIAAKENEWLFTAQETESLQKAFTERFPGITLNDLALDKNAKLNLKWRFYVQAPITPDGKFDQSGNTPFRRHIIESYGPNLANGQQVLLRIQRSYYPDDMLPIYGTAHFPDVDAGGYSVAIGEVLESHYQQICTIMEEFLENKRFNNDPPYTVLASSPAMADNVDLNEKGKKIPVNSHMDVKRMEPFDGGLSSREILNDLKEQGQTSSKAVDAVVGKAMGARTSATEANNIFQTAMSGVTTDINIFNYMAMGQGYAARVWRYIGLWMPDSIVRAVTGSMGFELKPQDFELRLGLKCDVGSTFIESITRQENLRYVIEASRMNPQINGSELWRMLLTEMKFPNVEKIVNDGGLEYSIRRANDEAMRAYRGENVMISPDVDHQVALRVKLAYLEDRFSVWNTSPEFAVNLPLLYQQIQQHQTWLQIQMQQMAIQQLALQPVQNSPQLPAQQATSPGRTAETPGQKRQQSGR